MFQVNDKIKPNGTRKSSNGYSLAGLISATVVSNKEGAWPKPLLKIQIDEGYIKSEHGFKYSKSDKPITVYQDAFEVIAKGDHYDIF